MENLPQGVLIHSQILSENVNGVMPAAPLLSYEALKLPPSLAFLPQTLFFCLSALLSFGIGLTLGGLTIGILASIWTALLLATASYNVWNDFYFETMLLSCSCAVTAYALALREAKPQRTFATELPLAAAIGFSFMVKSPLLILPLLLVAWDILSGKLRNGQTSWKCLAVLLLVPYLLLLPWMYMNWRVFHVFRLFEGRRADQNIITGALGIIHTLEGAHKIADLHYGQNTLSWAIMTICSHPVVYIASILQRIYTIFTWEPVLLTVFAAAVLRHRHDARMRALFTFGAYFILLHSFLSINKRYIYPIWPVLSAPAAALLAGTAPLNGTTIASRCARTLFAIAMAVMLFWYFTVSKHTVAYASNAKPIPDLLPDSANHAQRAGLAELKLREGRTGEALALARAALLARPSHSSSNVYAMALAVSGKTPAPVFRQKLLDCCRYPSNCLLVQSAYELSAGRSENGRRLFYQAYNRYMADANTFSMVTSTHELNLYNKQQNSDQTQHIATFLSSFIQVFPTEARMRFRHILLTPADYSKISAPKRVNLVLENLINASKTLPQDHSIPIPQAETLTRLIATAANEAASLASSDSRQICTINSADPIEIYMCNCRYYAAIAQDEDFADNRDNWMSHKVLSEFLLELIKRQDPALTSAINSTIRRLSPDDIAQVARKLVSQTPMSQLRQLQISGRPISSICPGKTTELGFGICVADVLLALKNSKEQKPPAHLANGKSAAFSSQSPVWIESLQQIISDQGLTKAADALLEVQPKSSVEKRALAALYSIILNHPQARKRFAAIERLHTSQQHERLIAPAQEYLDDYHMDPVVTLYLATALLITGDQPGAESRLNSAAQMHLSPHETKWLLQLRSNLYAELRKKAAVHNNDMAPPGQGIATRTISR